MAVALDNDELKHLKVKLKNGEYDGVDLMHAWLAIDELIDARKTLGEAKSTYVELTNSVSFVSNGETDYIAY